MPVKITHFAHTMCWHMQSCMYYNFHYLLIRTIVKYFPPEKKKKDLLIVKNSKVCQWHVANMEVPKILIVQLAIIIFPID